ncbi:MAG: nitroreductase family protein [Hyphomicrobiales bacterium]
MDAYQAIIKKRDRRNFLDRPIPEDVLHRILQAGRMAGSSKNAQPNRFVVVRDRAKIEAIAALSPLAKWLGTSAMIVVFVQEGREHPFDAGRAAQNMMLAAFADGVGSCPAHVSETELARLFGIPEGLHINRVIGFGYVDPARDAPPPSVARKRLPLEEIVHFDQW